MKKLLIGAIFLLISLTVFANEGFRSIDQMELAFNPEESIFRIVPKRVFIFSRYNQEQVASILFTECQQDDLNFVQQLNCEHLKSCYGESCYKPYLSSGTAFLIGDGSTLATAFHVSWTSLSAKWLFFKEILRSKDAKKREEMISNFPPEFALFNAKGEKVFDTDDGKVESISAGDQLKFIDNFQAGDFPFASEDYEFIRLSKVIGKPLRVASVLPSEGEKIFSIGFPQATKREGSSNSNGFNLTYSEGKVQNPENYLNEYLKSNKLPLAMLRSIDTESLKQKSGAEVLRVFGFSEEIIENSIEHHGEEKFETEVAPSYIEVYEKNHHKYIRMLDILKSKSVISHTMDIVPGNSGGPVFNQAGQVVGLNSLTHSTDTRYSPLGGAVKSIISTN